LLPFLGSGIILLPWSVILFLMGNLRLSIGLAILFVLTFLVNQILRPIFMGKSVGLKPIFTILITGISMLIFSPGLGALVGSIISLMLGVFFEVKEAFDIENNHKDEKEIEA
ncbi:MAG: AI-2E family transporter, partial [Anaerococcus sp.]|nr:AI-2E family transporter [Anaerococcus sp.]